MNIYYAKTILYSYSNLNGVINRYDEIIKKRALASMIDFSPCISQCEKIIELKLQKALLKDLIGVIERALEKFSQEEKDYLDYKYFRLKPKSYYNDFDNSSRAYFRRQVKVAVKFGNTLVSLGINDKVFEQEYLSTDYFKQLLKRVIEHENNCMKNKAKQSVKRKFIDSMQIDVKKIA